MANTKPFEVTATITRDQSGTEAQWCATIANTSAKGIFGYGNTQAEALDAMCDLALAWTESDACKYKHKGFTGVTVVVLSVHTWVKS